MPARSPRPLTSPTAGRRRQGSDPRHKPFSQPSGAGHEPLGDDLIDLSEGSGAAGWVAEEGAGMDGGAPAFRPGRHDLGAADAGGEGESAGQGLA